MILILQIGKKKILLVIKNYSTSDPGEFQYFNFFLYELSKQKPEIAVRLIGKSKLESFLIHIIAGLWSSRLQKEVRNIIIKWTQSNKNLLFQLIYLIMLIFLMVNY